MVTHPTFSAPAPACYTLTELCVYDYDPNRDGGGGAIDTFTLPTPGLGATTTGSSISTVLKRRSQKRNVCSDLQWSIAAAQVRTNCFFLPLTVNELGVSSGAKQQKKTPIAATATRNNMRGVLYPLISR